MSQSSRMKAPTWPRGHMPLLPAPFPRRASLIAALAPDDNVNCPYAAGLHLGHVRTPALRIRIIHATSSSRDIVIRCAPLPRPLRGPVGQASIGWPTAKSITGGIETPLCVSREGPGRTTVKLLLSQMLSGLFVEVALVAVAFPSTPARAVAATRCPAIVSLCSRSRPGPETVVYAGCRRRATATYSEPCGRGD